MFFIFFRALCKDKSLNDYCIALRGRSPSRHTFGRGATQSTWILRFYGVPLTPSLSSRTERYNIITGVYGVISLFGNIIARAVFAAAMQRSTNFPECYYNMHNARTYIYIHNMLLYVYALCSRFSPVGTERFSGGKLLIALFPADNMHFQLITFLPFQCGGAARAILNRDDSVYGGGCTAEHVRGL